MVKKKKKRIDLAKIKKESTKILKIKCKQIKLFVRIIRPGVWVVLTLITVLIIVLVVTFNKGNAIQKNDIKVVSAVSEIMLLPGDVQPIILTIADEQKMKDKTFFNNAKNGDKILVYQTIKRAILFRPSLEKIIDVAPINPITLFR